MLNDVIHRFILMFYDVSIGFSRFKVLSLMGSIACSTEVSSQPSDVNNVQLVQSAPVELQQPFHPFVDVLFCCQGIYVLYLFRMACRIRCSSLHLATAKLMPQLREDLAWQ